MALNLLKQDPLKASIKGKRKKAGWDDDYLLAVTLSVRVENAIALRLWPGRRSYKSL